MAFESEKEAKNIAAERTLRQKNKEINKASMSLASTISLSVIAPTPARITDSFTPSTFIFSRDDFTASQLPFTSAFKTMFISENPKK